MELSQHSTDAAVLKELGHRLARRRLRENLTQAQLAHEAGISKRTLNRLERGESSQLASLIRVLRALGLLGNLDPVVPLPPPSPIELLRATLRERRRASPSSKRSGPSSTPAPPSTWTWGDRTSRGGASP